MTNAPRKSPRLPSLLAAALLLPLALPAAAQDAPRADDRAIVTHCLEANKASPGRCIDTVYTPCVAAPSGSSTYGMGVCARRELLVWQEIMDASLQTLIGGPLGRTQAEPYNRPPENKRDHAVPGSDIIADMQRTWVNWRAKMCDTAAMEYEGGSLSRVIYGQCVYQETGRHALWLRALTEDIQQH